MSEVHSAVPAGDGHVLVCPLGAAYLARALSVVEREHRLAGVRPPAEWLELREVINRAAAFGLESSSFRDLPEVPSSRSTFSDRIGAGRVAELLGCSEPWARSLLRRGEFASARRRGWAWEVDQDEVLAWLLTRAVGAEAVA